MLNRTSIRKCLITSVMVTLMASIAFIGGCASNTNRADENTEPAGTLEITEQTTGSGITLTRTMLTADDYADNGISPQADSAFTITATVQDTAGNAPASLQLVTFAMAWTTASTDELSEYMTMTAAGTTATFTCLQAFTTQITVTCTSVLDTTKTATATIDYAKRLEGINLLWHGSKTLSSNFSKYSTGSYTVNTVAFSSVWNLSGTWRIRGISIDSFRYADLGAVNAEIQSITAHITLHTEYKNALIALGEPYSTIANAATAYDVGCELNKVISESDIFFNVFPELTKNDTWLNDGISTDFIKATSNKNCFFVRLKIATNIGETYYSLFRIGGSTIS